MQSHTNCRTYMSHEFGNSCRFEFCNCCELLRYSRHLGSYMAEDLVRNASLGIHVQMYTHRQEHRSLFIPSAYRQLFCISGFDFQNRYQDLPEKSFGSFFTCTWLGVEFDAAKYSYCILELMTLPFLSVFVGILVEFCC